MANRLFSGINLYLLTGEDPVEEEMVMNFLGEMQRGFKRKFILNQKNDYNYYVKI